jgi:3-phosphoshikimate 1-carboxyvinyltransferase
LVAGLLSNGSTTIENPLSCDDTEATANAVSMLGAKIVRDAQSWRVQSAGRVRAARSEIDCGESGVTLRFMIPIASLADAETTLRGSQGLMRRPLEPLVRAMEELSVKVTIERNAVRVEGGPPEGGTARIRGDVSSQFISGLLFAGPQMKNGLHLEVVSPLESRNYVLITIGILKRHGVEVQTNKEMLSFEVVPNQRYSAANHHIPGDYSSAAFTLAAAAVTDSKVLVRGLSRASSEPDAVFLPILSLMGARTSHQDNGVLVEGGRLKAATIDLRENPDLGPIVAVLGCHADGETRITGAARLRYKESDRIAAIISELAKLGADIIETEDGLITHGPSRLSGGVVQSHGDHRIAMALSVAALRASDRVIIEDAECVSKSYPNFFDDLRALGVEVVG